MSAIQSVVNDFGTLSILLLIGFFVRKRIKLLQNLYLPAALVAGFIGLLLGPQVLGKFTDYCIPLSPTIKSWPGVLTAVVFSVSFLGVKPRNFGETSLSASIHAGIGHQIQVCIGLICAAFFMRFYDFPLGFGLTPVYGFYGGPATSIAAGTLFQKLGWEAGLDVANTMATAGLISGVVLGVVLINIGIRKGEAIYVKDPSSIPDYIKVGYVEPQNRKPIGYGVTYNDVIDPFCFALCWSGLICASGHIVRSILIKINPVLSNIPWFACCLILSMIVGSILRKTGQDKYIDRPSMSRIAGFTMDYLVCSAICTLNLETVVTYAVPLSVTIAAILIGNLFLYPYFGRKLYARDAFERYMGGFGQGCGVVATALLLIRIVDPNNESTAGDAVVSSSTIGYIWMIPYFTIGPIISFSWGFTKLFVFSFALLVFFIVLGRVLCWQKRPSWETQERHYSE